MSKAERTHASQTDYGGPRKLYQSLSYKKDGLVTGRERANGLWRDKERFYTVDGGTSSKT
jgi:hypothetical protein